MTRPLLIGLSARIYVPGADGIQRQGVWTKTLHYLEQSAAQWVLSGGAVAVMVPAVDRKSTLSRSDIDLEHYADALDGLVLQGGNDIAPEQYGQQPAHPDWAGDPVRDAYEMALVRAFVAAGKPVFGICRGLQLLNVCFGGTLWQDIPSQRPESREHRCLSRYERLYHEVEFVPGSALAAHYPGQLGAIVNSIHHQGIRQLAEGFRIEARCPGDGMIEAIRREGPGYVAGVQWHPEFHGPEHPDTLDDGPILREFLAACAARRGA